MAVGRPPVLGIPPVVTIVSVLGTPPFESPPVAGRLPMVAMPALETAPEPEVPIASVPPMFATPPIDD